jgi:hypothetical protein
VRAVLVTFWQGSVAGSFPSALPRFCHGICLNDVKG